MAGSRNAEGHSHSPYDCSTLSETEHRHWGLSIMNNANAAVGNHYQFPQKRIGANSSCKTTTGDNDNRPRSCYPMEFSEIPYVDNASFVRNGFHEDDARPGIKSKRSELKRSFSYGAAERRDNLNLKTKKVANGHSSPQPYSEQSYPAYLQRTRSYSDRSEMTSIVRDPDISKESLPWNHNAEDAKRPSERGGVLLGKTGVGKQAKNFESTSIQPPENIQRRYDGSRENLGFCRLCHSQIYKPCHHFSSVHPTEDSSRAISERRAENGHGCVAGSKHAQMHQHYAHSDTREKPGKSMGTTTPRPSFQKAEAKNSRAESNTRETTRGTAELRKITTSGRVDASKTKQPRQKEDTSQSKRRNGRVEKTGHESEEGSERRQPNARPEIQKTGYSSRTNPAEKSLGFKATRQHELPNNTHANNSPSEAWSRFGNGTANRVAGATAGRGSGRTVTEVRGGKRDRNPWQVYHVTSEKPPGQAELTAAMVREVKELYPSLHSCLHVVPPVHFNMTKATEMPGIKGVYLAGDTPVSSTRADEARERIIDVLREVLKDRRAFVLPGVTFEDYLNKRIPAPGALCSAAAPHQSQRTVPIPYFPKSADLSPKYRRGQVEVLIVDKARGLLIMDVKVVGDNFEDMQVSVSQAVELVRKVLEKALTLMAKNRDVVLHLVSDIRATVPVNLLLALPNLRRDLLERTLEAYPELEKALQRCLNTRAPLAERCLCAEDLPGKHQASTDHDVLHLAEWWARYYPDSGPQVIEDDVYETIIGRFCGPFSTVSVWTPPHQAPRPEVRTLGQAVRETGDRCATLVLLPQQMDVLQLRLPRVHLTGPPGSGKTLVLILKGVRWVSETGGVVIVLSPKAEPSAVSLVIQRQILHTLRQLGHDVTENDVTTDTIVTDYDGLCPGTILVRRLKRLMKSRSEGGQERPLCLLLDEIQGEVIPYVVHLCQRLPGVCFWGSGAWPSSCPPGFDCQELSTPVRCPPAVQRLLEMTEPSTDGWHTKNDGTGSSSSSSSSSSAAGSQYRYITRSTEIPHHPLPSSGLPVKLLSHAAHHGHRTAGGGRGGGGGRDDVPILECHQCAEELVDYLRVLRVGRDIGPGEVLILTADRAPLEHGFHSSKFVQCLLRSGLQLDLIHDYAGSQKKLAFPSDKITVTCFQFVVGLERKVVVFLPEGTVRDNVDPEDFMDNIGTLSVENSSGYESDDEESDAEDMFEEFGTLWDRNGTERETSRAEDQAGIQDHNKDAISGSQSSESPAFLPSSSNLNNVNLNCSRESGTDDDAYFSKQDTSEKDSCDELVKERLWSATSTQAHLFVGHAKHEGPRDDDAYSSRRDASDKEEQDEAEKRLENGQPFQTLLTLQHARHREDDDARFSKHGTSRQEERGDNPSALHRRRNDRLQRTDSSLIVPTVSCHANAKQPTDPTSDSLSGPKSELPSNPNMSEKLSRSRTKLPSFPKPEMNSSPTAETHAKMEPPSNPNSEKNSSLKTEPPPSRKLQTHLSSPKAKIPSNPNSETLGERRANWPSEAPTTEDKQSGTGTEAGRRRSGVVQGCSESSRLRAAVDSMSASNRDSLWFSASRALAHAVVFHFSDSLC